MNKYEAVYYFTLYRGEHALNQIEPEALRSDPDVVKAACTHGKGLTQNLLHASDSLRRDKSFALLLAKENEDPAALQYFSETLRDDKDVVLAFVKHYQGGGNLAFASERLKLDDDVLEQALNYDGLALAHVPENKRSDRKLIDRAFNKTPAAFKYVPKHLLEDREFVLDFVTENMARDGILQYLPQFADDREVVMQILAHDSHSLQYASDSLRANAEVVLQAMFRPLLNHLPAMGFEFASLALRQDKDFVKQVIARLKGYRPDYRTEATAAIKEVHQIALSFKKGSEAAELATLKAELKKVIKALKESPNSSYTVSEQTQVLMGLKDRLLAHKDNPALMVILAEADYARSKFHAKDRGSWLALADQKLLNDRKFLGKIMKVTEGQALAQLDSRWQADADFVIDTIARYTPSDSIALNLRQDPEFILQLAKQVEFTSQLQQIAAPELWENRDFVLKILACNGLYLESVSTLLRADREVVEVAVQRTPASLRYADKSFFSDRGFMRAALIAGSSEAADNLAEPLVSDVEFLLECLELAHKDHSAMPRRLIGHVPRKVLSDKRFLIACLKRNGWCIEHVPETLRYDEDVLKAAFSSGVFVWKHLDLEKLRSLYTPSELLRIVGSKARMDLILSG